MPKKETTRTEIVQSENVLLGREHLRFLDELLQRLDKESGYKSTKSQIMRLLVEGAMRRNIRLRGIKNEDELRQALNDGDSGDKTRIGRN